MAVVETLLMMFSETPTWKLWLLLGLVVFDFVAFVYFVWAIGAVVKDMGDVQD